MAMHICIVGAGLAGGVLAARLAERGHRVTLIEQGNTPSPLIPRDEDWEGAYSRSTFTRGEGVGGSSNYWHAGLLALDRSDVEGRSTMGNGQKYQISYSEFCEHYGAALEMLTGGALTLDELLAEDVESKQLTIDGEWFRLKRLFFPPIPFSTAALIEAAVQKFGLKVITNFHVEKLLFGEAAQVTHVEGCYDGQSERRRIEADLFVLCAGGVGSPKILLKSAGSNSRLAQLPIGQYLIDHPTGIVFKAKLRRRLNLKEFFQSTHGSGGLWKRLAIVLRPDHLPDSSGRNHVLYLRPAFSLRSPRQFYAIRRRLGRDSPHKRKLSDVLKLVSYADLLLEAVNFRYAFMTKVRFVSGFVFVEQLPDNANRMALGEDGRYKIRWDVSATDASSLSVFLQAFIKRHAPMFDKVHFLQDSLESGAHHAGGCRMAAEPSQGVVDKDLRVFGTDNLFVADASSIPYAGHANIGLTIAALALRCADAVDAQARLPMHA